MPRAERRAQILDAATRAFARTGFSATSLDDVAAEAGVTHVILYRHFDSKTDLYRAVLDGVVSRLADKLGTDDYDEGWVAELLRAAARSGRIPAVVQARHRNPRFVRSSTPFVQQPPRSQTSI